MLLESLNIFNYKTKKTILFLLIGIFSCSKNDFSNTQLYIKTNKKQYRVNDTFELKVLIHPNKDTKTIRFYKEFTNLHISFKALKEQSGFRQETKQKIIHMSLSGDDNDLVNKYDITETKPFEKSFYGNISEYKNKVVIKIPALQIIDSINKTTLKKSTTVIIDGFCNSVYDVEETNFKEETIEILLE